MVEKKKDEPTPEEKAATRKEEIKENIIAAAIVILLVIAVSWWMYNQLHPAAPPPSTEEPRQNIAIGASPLLGNESARIMVVEFSDFECPFCGEFARDQFPTIKARYIDTGQVRFAFKHFPLAQEHPDAQVAAEASVCAQDQDNFWEYHDILYRNQDKLGINDLEGYAAQLGLDNKTFADCLSQGMRQTDVAVDKGAGQKAGVTGTPTFFFNGRKVVGAITADQFGQEIATETK